MRRLFICFILIIFAFFKTKSQTILKKDPSLGVHFGFFDFQKQKPLLVLGLSFINGINSNFDYSVNLMGTSIKYPFRNKPASKAEKLLLEFDATFRWKPFTDKSLLSPFISAGIGTSLYIKEMGVLAPVGSGIQLQLAHGMFLFSEFQYRVPLSHQVSSHFLYSLGISGNLIFRKKVILKKLPNQAPEIFQYDIDQDGITDSLDKCPTVYGYANYQGCPVPDTDGDGLNDLQDKCPTIPGPAQYEGCPIPDSDGDGVDDSLDKCPFLTGPVNSGGCPVKPENLQDMLDSIASSVFFQTGKAVLTEGTKQVLSNLVLLLNAKPTMLLTVEGHTDNQGNAVANKLLSLRRAEAVRTYLMGRGIDGDRLIAVGFGHTKPVASNNTVAGRAANRRVELNAGQKNNR